MLPGVPFVLVQVLHEGLCIEENRTCTKESCRGPFPMCDKVTGACEALNRSDIYPNGWIDINLDAMSEVFFRVVCSVDGNYPSADCRTFYHCKEGIPTLKTCSSPGYPFFDPVLQRCTNINKCSTFDCFNKPNLKVGLKDDLSPFFAYCLHLYRLHDSNYDKSIRTINTILPKVIARCYGHDTFNSNTGRCEPMCFREGPIPDTTNCHNFFLCILSDPIKSEFTMLELQCPEGEAFLDVFDGCISEQIVQSCTQRYPWPI